MPQPWSGHALRAHAGPHKGVARFAKYEFANRATDQR